MILFRARPGVVRLGEVWHCAVRLGLARHSVARQGFICTHDSHSGRCVAWLGTARWGVARLGKDSRYSFHSMMSAKARLGCAGHGLVGRGRVFD
jgi:hypothetical protein